MINPKDDHVSVRLKVIKVNNDAAADNHRKYGTNHGSFAKEKQHSSQHNFAKHFVNLPPFASMNITLVQESHSGEYFTSIQFFAVSIKHIAKKSWETGSKC